MKHLWALHGFGGSPQDFDVLRPLCKKLDFVLHAVDLYPLVQASRGFDDIADVFCDEFAKESGEHHVLGYSMGGRMALSLLNDHPELLSSLMVVSANPGLESTGEKEKRYTSDLEWARKFRELEWQKLWELWNGQGVLKMSAVHPKVESNYDRDVLAACFEKFSLGLQPNYRSVLSEAVMPVGWLTGEKDEKFQEMARLMRSSLSNVCFYELEGAGHRTIWDNLEGSRCVFEQFWTK